MASVTLKDIAKECGISFSAVSKALKDSPEIGEKTIKLVKETAERLGYHPNAAARTLRTKRSYDIGVIFEDITGSGLQHQYFARIFDAINVAANNAGYNITFLNFNKKSRTYLAQAENRNCDGVIIASAQFERPDIQALLASNIPICALDYNDGGKHSAVLSDHTEGIRQLTEFAISQGHKNLAYIHGEPTNITQKRIDTFLSVTAKHGIQIPERNIREGKYHDPASSAIETEIILDQQDSPTCIFYPDDFAALGGIRILSALGITPGRNISIAGYDGIFLSSLLTPPLTTYEQNAKQIGQNLVALLLEHIENSGTFRPVTISVSGKFIQGKSIAKI